ncbi:MAG: hypothetical protein ACLSFT_05815 [Ruminococcus callidus]
MAKADLKKKVVLDIPTTEEEKKRHSRVPLHISQKYTVPVRSCGWGRTRRT